MLEGGGYKAERRIKGKKLWGNCNRIINKIYFKNNYSINLFTFQKEIQVKLGSGELATAPKKAPIEKAA